MFGNILLGGLLLLCTTSLALAASRVELVQQAGLAAFGPGVPAADFTLMTPDGTALRLEEQRGHVVVLNFWATWCAPCRLEMPLFQKLHQELQQRPLRVWAIAVHEGRDKVAPFLAEQGLTFTALLDPQGEVSGLYAVRGLPATMLIDCAGKIVGHATGVREWTSEVFRALLDHLFEETTCRK